MTKTNNTNQCLRLSCPVRVFHYLGLGTLELHFFDPPFLGGAQESRLYHQAPGLGVLKGRLVLWFSKPIVLYLHSIYLESWGVVSVVVTMVVVVLVLVAAVSTDHCIVKQVLQSLCTFELRKQKHHPCFLVVLFVWPPLGKHLSSVEPQPMLVSRSPDRWLFYWGVGIF